MDKKNVYIVTSGEYSDYHIVQVFSSKALADEFLDMHDDDYQVEVFELDKVMPERKRQIFVVNMDLKNKKVGWTECRNYYEKDLIRIEKKYDGTQYLSIYIESDSKKRAIKVASERFGAIIANEQIMYPFLRMGVMRRYGSLETPFYDFNTGELVIPKEYELGCELPDYVKVRKEAKK